MLRPIVAALSPLAAVAFAVWPLSAPLAAPPRDAAGRERARHGADAGDLLPLNLAGENSVGTPFSWRNALLFAADDVAYSCGGRIARRSRAAAIRLHLAGHLLRFGHLRAWLPFFYSLRLIHFGI